MNLSNLQLNQQKKILIVIFLLAIVYVDVGYILKAQRAGLRRLDPKISRVKTDLANLNRGLENMRLAKISPAAPGQKKVVKSSRIIAESQISELLQEISTAANKFDIKIDQIRPSRQVQKEKSAKEKAALGKDNLSVMLINLDMVCDYHSLGKFIQDLENSSVFMGVQELVISTQPLDYMKQKVSLVLKTYVIK